MSDAKHTSGPWTAVSPEDHGTGDNWWVMNATGQIVCDLTTQPEEDANARLMAAAPELLKACQALKLMANCMSFGPGWTDELYQEVMGFADATVAKAKGETQ